MLSHSSFRGAGAFLLAAVLLCCDRAGSYSPASSAAGLGVSPWTQDRFHPALQRGLGMQEGSPPLLARPAVWRRKMYAASVQCIISYSTIFLLETLELIKVYYFRHPFCLLLKAH